MRINSINSVYVTNTSKIFVLNDNTNTQHTYIADVDKNDSVFSPSDTSNKAALSTNIGLIHNMYSISECFLKSAQKIGNDNQTDSFANIFSHELSANTGCYFTTAQNTIYGITSKDVYGHYVLSTDIYGYISSDTGHILPEDVEISTLLFNKTAIKNGDFDNMIKSNIRGVQYNKIIEIPDRIYNDFDSGNFHATTYVAKNHYSSRYNMEYNSSSPLTNSRNYIGIGSSQNCVYLKYHDNIHYSSMNNNGYSTLSQKYKYPQVEVLGAMSRDNITNTHKTGLYSLDINTHCNSTIAQKNNGAVLRTLQLQISNIVKTYLKKLAPANTQFFKINVT